MYQLAAHLHIISLRKRELLGMIRPVLQGVYKHLITAALFPEIASALCLAVPGSQTTFTISILFTQALRPGLPPRN